MHGVAWTDDVVVIVARGLIRGNITQSDMRAHTNPHKYTLWEQKNAQKSALSNPLRIAPEVAQHWRGNLSKTCGIDKEVKNLLARRIFKNQNKKKGKLDPTVLKM